MSVAATGRWFSSGNPVSSTNKMDGHDIVEILLKVALNTITLTLYWNSLDSWYLFSWCQGNVLCVGDESFGQFFFTWTIRVCLCLKKWEWLWGNKSDMLTCGLNTFAWSLAVMVDCCYSYFSSWKKNLLNKFKGTNHNINLHNHKQTYKSRSLVGQELFTLQDNPRIWWGSCCSILIFLCCI